MSRAMLVLAAWSAGYMDTGVTQHYLFDSNQSVTLKDPRRYCYVYYIQMNKVIGLKADVLFW